MCFLTFIRSFRGTDLDNCRLPVAESGSGAVAAVSSLAARLARLPFLALLVRHAAAVRGQYVTVGSVHLPELCPLLEELQRTAGVLAAELIPAVGVLVAAVRPLHTDGDVLVPAGHSVALLALLALAGAVQARAGCLVQPVEAGVEVAHVLVAQLGAVTVVYTGHLLHVRGDMRGQSVLTPLLTTIKTILTNVT